MANLVKKPAQILGNAASAVTTAATSTVSAGLQATVDVGKKLLNPFNVADDIISHNIISIHDSQAVRHDVDSLYNVVSNIVRSSTNITNSLDLKQVKSVDLVEDKVPQSGFKPSYNMLKEIACQMTCHPFNATDIHGSVVGVLEKLKSYTWDAKAVIALSAFALDFGETWRLSLMQATNKKENALELHIFKLGEEEDAKKTKEKANADLISTLVDRTLQLIDGIIKLEKLIANKAYSSKDVPALFKAPRDLYTYWAILGLMACANQMSHLEWNIKSEIVGRIKLVLTQLNADLEEIKLQIDLLNDFTWRLNVFQTPSGILELLKALIFPKDFKQLDIIFDATTKKLVKLDELKTKNLLLFISGLDNIEDEIWALKPIHDSITKEKDKKDYKIVWVPVVENWTNEAKEKFEHLKSLMPWYVVQYLSLVKGYKPLQEEWNYTGKPIVVVTNPRGEVINKNALHLIFVWGISAFPFRREDEERVSQHWNWLWNEVFKINADIQKWVSQENKYVFLYGGTDITLTQRYGNLVETIRNDPLIKQTDTYIEHFNLAKVDITTQTKFWLNITNSFLSKIQKLDFNLDSTLKDIQTLLSMKTEKGWALVSKGENVLVLGYNELIAGVLEGFESWKKNVVEFQGFDIAFKDYYDRVSAGVPLHCLHFELNNIRSGVPTNMSCPNQSCGRKMEIESVNYKCCHGMHSDQATQNGEIVDAAVTKTKLFGTP
ncbi:protein SIEVE ELEMENT OCCLUSION B-like [Arachis stenosperma]|uniref:protein SIEVE ELEMENT OCCLUSION B-like n=1 Tax=Arachis stenosperma TaxID=217475 RepID=UPI0025AB981D|nr:protein SIEVE ELEMENT OCCLUSION B-like [Arachis stenosperma]